VQGVDHIVPVDMYIPGCPPRPEMLIDALLKLHDKIRGSDISGNLTPREGRDDRLPAAAVDHFPKRSAASL
jgi:NADH-quinone oxidoreductase subunit B